MLIIFKHQESHDTWRLPEVSKSDLYFVPFHCMVMQCCPGTPMMHAAATLKTCSNAICHAMMPLLRPVGAKSTTIGRQASARLVESIQFESSA